MRAKCSIFLHDVVSLDMISVILVEQAKVTAASWGPFDNYLVTGHENGVLCQYDLRVRQWCCVCVLARVTLCVHMWCGVAA